MLVKDVVCIHFKDDDLITVLPWNLPVQSVSKIRSTELIGSSGGGAI